MSRISVACLWLACAVACGGEAQPQPAWPLWDGQESIEHYAKRVNLPPTKTLDLGNGVNLELVLIPAGKFTMGLPDPVKPQHTVEFGQTVLGVSSTAMLAMVLFVIVRALRRRQRPQFSLLGLLCFVLSASIALYGGIDWWQMVRAWREYKLKADPCRYSGWDFSEHPSHEVTLTTPRFMGKYEVTQDQYRSIMDTAPNIFKGANLPAERVSWDDAVAFCRKASERAKGLVRLPTEAEWEYGCRAGTMTDYFTGDIEADLGRAAWYDTNSGRKTHPVGQKEANVFSLYDMHGNVCEWCLDYWSDGYSPETAIDPQGTPKGDSRVLRGGSWGEGPVHCRSSSRGCDYPGERNDTCGFRVVVEVELQR